MSASDVARALQSFRAAASEKGAYDVQRDSAANLLRCLDRHFGSSVGEPPTAAVVTALHTLRTTLDRLLVNISCRMAQRASTLPPIRASLADTRRNAAVLCRQLERHWPEAAPPSPDAAPSPTAAPAVATHPPAIDGSCPLLSRCGPRHLCAYGCFFDAFEPARRLQSLRAALEARGATGACLDGWRVERVRSGAGASSSPARGDGAEGGKRRRTTGCAASPGATTSSSSSWHFVSPSGATFASVGAAVRAFADGSPSTSGERQGGPRGLEARSVSAESEDAAAGLRRVTSPYFKDRPPSGAVQPTPPRALGATGAGGRANWRPPRSPYGLLEELLWDRPWALLLACILLNQTTRRQVDPVMARLLDAFPDAPSLAEAEPGAVEPILRPLGLHRQRSRSVVAFSAAFVAGGWARADALPGVGKYGRDAHAIFCEGRYRETQPEDFALRWYRSWLLALDV